MAVLRELSVSWYYSEWIHNKMFILDGIHQKAREIANVFAGFSDIPASVEFRPAVRSPLAAPSRQTFSRLSSPPRFIPLFALNFLTSSGIGVWLTNTPKNTPERKRSILMVNSNRLKKRILFVEDDEENWEIVALNLEDCVVVCARDLNEGVRLARIGYFDLYLLDNKLPDGTGVELCRAIRKFTRTRRYCSTRQQLMRATNKKHRTRARKLISPNRSTLTNLCKRFRA